MTSNEFVTWFKGFVAAANTYNITPKQWDVICEELDKVVNNPTKWTKHTLDASNWNTTSTGKITDTTYKQDELTTNTVF